jgi:hypothetical protein
LRVRKKILGNLKRPFADNLLEHKHRNDRTSDYGVKTMGAVGAKRLVFERKLNGDRMEFFKFGTMSSLSFPLPQAVTAYAREAATKCLDPAFALRDRASEALPGIAERLFTAPTVFHEAASGWLARAVQLKDGGDVIPWKLIPDPWELAQRSMLIPLDSSVWQAMPLLAGAALGIGVSAAVFAATLRPSQTLREREKINGLIARFMTLKTRIEDINEEIAAAEAGGTSISDAEKGEETLIGERQDLLTRLHATWQELYVKHSDYHGRFSGSVFARSEASSLLQQISVITAIHDRLVGERYESLEGGVVPRSRLDQLEESRKRPKGLRALPLGWGMVEGGQKKPK